MLRYLLQRKYSIVLACITLCVLFFIIKSFYVVLPTEDTPIQFYSNQCQQDIKHTYLAAIAKAESDIFLIMFSLTDKEIIHALNRKAAMGVRISCVLDVRNPSYVKKQLHPNITYITPKEKGLLHQKILVVDNTLLFIGSSNLTRQSLRMHDNLVVGMYSPLIIQEIIKTIEEPLPSQNKHFMVKEQAFDFYALPNYSVALPKLCHMLSSAKKNLQIAMFTWTHPLITEAVITAKKNGVNVSVAIDYKSSLGASKKTVERLLKAGIPVYRNTGMQLLHHKFALIDDEILINGSTNWTQAAFEKNRDCFFVLFPLNKKEQKFMQKLWRSIQLEGLAM